MSNFFNIFTNIKDKKVRQAPQIIK